MKNIYNEKIDILDREEYDELIARYKLYNDKEAFNKIVTASIPLIKKFAEKEMRESKTTSYDDYFQQSTIGFIKALNSFDINNEKNARFFTYLYIYLPRYLKKYTYEHEKSCMNLRKNYFLGYLKAIKFEREYIEENGIKPTIEQKAAVAEVPVDKYAEYEHIFINHLNMSSLNELTPKTKDRDTQVELQDIVPDIENKSVEDKVETKVMVEKCLSYLKGREREIFELYHLNEISQNRIAEIMETNQVAISRSLSKSMKTIRKKMRVI